MNRLRYIFVFAAGLVLTAPPIARAQDTDTRAGQAEQQRAEKAQQLEPYQPGKVERALLLVENRYLAQRLVNPPRGLFTRWGGMPEGQGFTVGPAYRFSNYDASFTTTAAISIIGAYEATGRLEFPRPTVAPARPASRFLSLGGLYHHLPREDFYGFGQQSSPDTRANFLLNEGTLDVTAGLAPVDWFTVSGIAEYRREQAGRGNDPLVPSIELLHTGVGAPASQLDLDFVRLGGQTYFNYAGAPQRAPVGGRYLLSLNKYLDQTADQYSFSRWEVDLQQYIPVFTPSRLIALRANAIGVIPDDGNDVPFYLQPTLGGSHTIRAYSHQRFRDRNAMVLQAEYRYILNDFMTGSVFYDTGKVAFDRRDLWDFDGMKNDYGISVRFGFAGIAALRAEIAWGGDEGTVYALRFSDVF
jgi:hypothetical protein